MKKVHSCIIATLLLLALSLSASAMGRKKLQKIMDSWMNETKHSLIMSWGPPARTADDGAGGEVLIYAEQRATNGYYMLQTWIPGRSWYDYRMFYVNASGIIYSWRTDSQDVPPMQLNINANVNVYNH